MVHVVRRGLLALSMVVLAGCAATGRECKLPEPASDKAGELVVYRPPQRVGSIVHYTIELNDCSVGYLVNGSSLSQKVTAGAVKIHLPIPALAIGGAEDIRAGVGVGETVYVRLAHITQTGLEFKVVDKATAEKEIAAFAAKAQ
jgi:hypothetical protein